MEIPKHFLEAITFKNMFIIVKCTCVRGCLLFRLATVLILLFTWEELSALRVIILHLEGLPALRIIPAHLLWSVGFIEIRREFPIGYLRRLCLWSFPVVALPPGTRGHSPKLGLVSLLWNAEVGCVSPRKSESNLFLMVF